MNFLFSFFVLLLSPFFSYAYDVSIVSMFHNDAPYLKEWVEYHHMIGVDHFWLYNDASTDHWDEVLKPYIEQGIVEVFYWPAGKPDWVPGQIAAFQDGLKRALGTTKWVTLLDQDEFILPMKDKNILECLEKHFSKASAVFMNWRNFGTSNITVKEGEPLLTYLTRCSKRTHSRNVIGKSFFRPEAVQIEKLWYPHHAPLIAHALYLNGSGKPTLNRTGDDWSTDGKNHDQWIRINHYALRDENYYRNRRLPRDPNPNLIKKLHQRFNKKRDLKILKFIEENYPEKYQKIWKR